MKNTYLPTLLLLFVWVGLKAQDPHLSQPYNAPLLLNPAMTGLINGDVRAVANYRTQWGSVATPFRTMALSAEVSAFKNYLDDDMLGVGLLILNDVAGVSSLRNTQVQLSAGFSKSLNNQGNNYVSFGAQVGYAQQRIDMDELLFDNQFNGQDLSPALPSGEDFLSDQIGYVDFKAGLAWSYTPDRFTSFYMGLAMAHLNQPMVSFYGNLEELLHVRTTAHAGMEFRANYLMSIIPRVVYHRQGPSSQLQTGSLLKFNMGDVNGYDDMTSIYLGGMYRWQDAMVFITRFEYGSFGLSFSYDMNTSSLARASRGHGAAEIALMYQHTFVEPNRYNRKLNCPKF